jgi:hypothetical protein
MSRKGTWMSLLPKVPGEQRSLGAVLGIEGLDREREQRGEQPRPMTCNSSFTAWTPGIHSQLTITCVPYRIIATGPSRPVQPWSDRPAQDMRPFKAGWQTPFPCSRAPPATRGAPSRGMIR